MLYTILQRELEEWFGEFAQIQLERLVSKSRGSEQSHYLEQRSYRIDVVARRHESELFLVSLDLMLQLRTAMRRKPPKRPFHAPRELKHVYQKPSTGVNAEIWRGKGLHAPDRFLRLLGHVRRSLQRKS